MKQEAISSLTLESIKKAYEQAMITGLDSPEYFMSGAAYELLVKEFKFSLKRAVFKEQLAEIVSDKETK